MRLVLFSVLAFTLCLKIAFQVHVQVERDISRYEKGGTIELYIFRDDDKSYAAKEGQFREFLQAHWRDHRLGYIVVRRHPIDQTANTTHYFIEPDKDGIWHVLMSVHRVEPDPDDHTRGRPVTEELSIYDLRRAEYKKDAVGNWIFIPADAKRSPSSYVLVISDKAGKILGYQ
jgi:hypothetical protein